MLCSVEFSLPFLPAKANIPPLTIPLAKEHIAAGFPSPADDYIDIGIDLNEHLIQHPASTFFLHVSGNSMSEAGIQNGDLLIVDRSINPRPGHVVVARLDGSFTLKRLVLKQNRLQLKAENPSYPSLDLLNYQDVQIWGVAIYSIHNLRRKSPLR